MSSPCLCQKPRLNAAEEGRAKVASPSLQYLTSLYRISRRKSISAPHGFRWFRRRHTSASAFMAFWHRSGGVHDVASAGASAGRRARTRRHRPFFSAAPSRRAVRPPVRSCHAPYVALPGTAAMGASDAWHFLPVRSRPRVIERQRNTLTASGAA